jgi:hypothetical protein
MPLFHEVNRRLRGHGFMPPVAELRKLPRIYAQDGTPDPDKTCYLHYFAAGTDIWVVEGGPVDDACAEPDYEFFAYVRHAHLANFGEWGYQFARHLEAQEFRATRGIRYPFVIQRDLHWTPRPMWSCERSGLYDNHGYLYVDRCYANAPQEQRAAMCRKAKEDGAPTDAAAWHGGRWWTVETASPHWRAYFGLPPVTTADTGPWLDHDVPKRRW